MDRPRIAYVLNSPSTAQWNLAGQFRALSQAGFDVLLIAPPHESLERVRLREGIAVAPVAIDRQISPGRDLRTLRRLTSILDDFRPHIVRSGNPKGGLLGMIAARRLNVPVRIYGLHGLRLETTSGWKRALLTACERAASRFAHHVLCVSPSLRDSFVQMTGVPAAKTVVLGCGSSNGVDLARFRRSPAQRDLLRNLLGVADDDLVLGYVGRLVPDKGIDSLWDAFRRLGERFPTLRLVLVGGLEAEDPLPERLYRELAAHPRVHVTGFVPRPEHYLSTFDVLAFPSLREGFPKAVLEAMACELPVVGYRVTGTLDAVEHDVTGRLFEAGDVDGLIGGAAEYLADPALRARHGEAARSRVEREFCQTRVWDRLIHFYLSALEREGFFFPALTVDGPPPLSVVA